MPGISLFSIRKKRKPAYKKSIALTLSYKLGVDFLKLSNSRSAFNSSFADNLRLSSKKETLRFEGSPDVIVSIKTFIIASLSDYRFMKITEVIQSTYYLYLPLPIIQLWW